MMTERLFRNTLAVFIIVLPLAVSAQNSFDRYINKAAVAAIIASNRKNQADSTQSRTAEPSSKNAVTDTSTGDTEQGADAANGNNAYTGSSQTGDMSPIRQIERQPRQSIITTRDSGRIPPQQNQTGSKASKKASTTPDVPLSAEEERALSAEAKAMVNMHLEMMGERPEDCPKEIYAEIYKDAVNTLRADPKQRKGIQNLMAMSGQSAEPSKSSSSNTIICRSCGGHYNVLPPGVINSTPTDCPAGGITSRTGS
jgi:hypothetical protein